MSTFTIFQVHLADYTSCGLNAGLLLVKRFVTLLYWYFKWKIWHLLSPLQKFLSLVWSLFWVMYYDNKHVWCFCGQDLVQHQGMMKSSLAGESAGLWRQQLPVLLAGEPGPAGIPAQLPGQRLPFSRLCQKPVGAGDCQRESQWRSGTTRSVGGWN